MRRLVVAACLMAGLPAAAAAPAAVPTAVPAAASAQQVESGRRLFARCAGCHEVGPTARNVFGPHLNGVLGRQAGSVPGYAYSPALKNARIVWDARRLAAFIDDPDEVVPGNKMRFFSFMNARQVADIVAYLGTQRAVPTMPPPAR